ncbi:MAG: hypothetical protein K6V73_10960 [Firmicutes bacterium]|nr:hypothetical protein [Bacillota bacterium]
MVTVLLAVTTVVTGTQAKASRRGPAVHACSSRVGHQATALAAASATGFMPFSCAPVAEEVDAFGGALAGGYALATADGTLPAVVDEHGNAWVVTGSPVGPHPQALEQVSPSGTQLWVASLPATAGLVAGDSEVLVLKDSDGEYTIFDTLTHRMSTIRPPDYQQAQNGGININTSVGVVGAFAVLETSEYAGNGEGVATQNGTVEVYNANGALVHRFQLPHRSLSVQPDQPVDSAQVVTYGSNAYVVWNDAPAGNQAGVFTVTASGMVLGSFSVPVEVTGQGSGTVLALPSGHLFLTNPATGKSALVSVNSRGVRTIWRRTVYGGAPRFGGNDIVTAGNTLRAYRLVDGSLAFEARLRGFSLQPLVAGPFGAVAEAKSVRQAPELVLVDPEGKIVWRRTLRTGRLFPLAVDAAGSPAVYLGPNLPLVVWK